MDKYVMGGVALIAPLFLQACSGGDPHMCNAPDSDYEATIANKSVFSHFIPIWTGKVMVMIPQYRQAPRPDDEKQVLREQRKAACAANPEAGLK
jgi:hypothetical protein